MASVSKPLTLVSSRYHLLKPLARGGLSEVFLAHDEELNREVALKVMRRDRRRSASGRARLLFEAELTAGLEHPGVVPIYGRGVDAYDQPYFAMRYVHGMNLTEAARSQLDRAPRRAKAQNLRRLVDRLVDICYTVDFANRRGIIHRDLTPRNLMLGTHGETLVIDWGLARRIGSSAPDTPLQWPASARALSETRIGSSVGTPRYMSPEQAEGRWDRLGPASDVFTLGATLYRLLTGRAPFDDDDPGVSEAKAGRVQCPRPREVQSQVPAALEAVCLKAMMRQPESRYASAIELGDDLARWVAGEAVSVPRVATVREWQRQRAD